MSTACPVGELLSRTAVVVLTMNRRDALRGVLFEATSWSDIGGVIVVDNSSTDGTADAVSTEFPGVTLVRSAENLGAAGGRSLGLRRASQESYEFVFLAEDDTALSREALERCLQVMSVEPTAALVGTYGGIFRVGWVRWGRYRPSVRSTAVEECDFVLLDGCLARTAAMDEVGHLRDDYFIMFEEQEVGRRLQRRGYRILCVAADVHRAHAGAILSGAPAVWRAYYQTRNHLRFCLDARSPTLLFGFVARFTHQVAHEVGRRRWSSVRLRLRGAADGVWGRLGRRVEPA